MREVVVNTGPLQYLHQLGLLELLPDFYGRVLVPRAMANKLAKGFPAHPASGPLLLLLFRQPS